MHIDVEKLFDLDKQQAVNIAVISETLKKQHNILEDILERTQALEDYMKAEIVKKKFIYPLILAGLLAGVFLDHHTLKKAVETVLVAKSLA